VKEKRRIQRGQKQANGKAGRVSGYSLGGRCSALESVGADATPGGPPHCHVLHYLRIENAEGYVLIAVYLFIYLYACYSHNSKSIKPNRMKFGGMISYYPGTI